MVAIAILGVSVVAIFQLFSINLRSTKKAENNTKALFYARSMLDEAYSIPDPTDSGSSIEFEEDFKGSREATLKASSENENVKLYEITVTITWPPSGNLTIKGLRTVYENNQ